MPFSRMTRLAPAALPLLALPLLALPLLAPLPALADDIPGTDFASNGWTGRAWADNGTFVDCYFGATYANGEILTISLTPDDALTVYLSAPGATFDPRKKYQATLMTEISWPVPGEAFAPNDGYIGFSLEGVDASIEFLTMGTWLRMLDVGIDQPFDIRGIGGALAEAKACLTEQTGGAKTAAADPSKPGKAGLGTGGNGIKPAQMVSGGAEAFKRTHQPCRDGDCK